MDGIGRGGGDGGRGGALVVSDDLVEDGIQCSDHPYRHNIPAGGVCAYCLQEKLGKLVSSSSPFFIGSSSSSSPTFRSDIGGAAAADLTTITASSATLSLSLSTSRENGGGGHWYFSRRARIPFVLTQKKNKKVTAAIEKSTSFSLIRSKSTTAPRHGPYLASEVEGYSPQKRGFWSFLYFSKHAATRKSSPRDLTSTTTATSTSQSLSRRLADASAASASRTAVNVAVDESDSPSTGGSNAASFGRKVSRSRSVGCGSRSFSGDFFERISTGFGDCTLRRVESQSEGKRATPVRGEAANGDAIKERVRCGGIFSGFMMTSSSSSSSSSSYWVSGSTEDGKGSAVGLAAAAAALAHGRSRSWGWAFASPMRAFSKPPPSSMKTSKNADTPPNLAAIPSLLAA
ncbi:hypothetical protein Nepgr_021892 [Nepenthes gracilis]|uniref:Uncharacterized protein n=1 Tax=Nepenthes gracilis TaxID=150966 RepID=A0AAD3SZS3_NEPGR|nr:hypothetical protein Nepgr_021892 [Nepenthes gracilis]